jgi:Cysteine-rich domain
MPLPIGDVIGILADNLRLRKSVMPLSTRRATRWAKGLNLPMGGDTVLYTGHMYQLMASIAALESQMAGMENSWVTRTMGVGRMVNKFINTSRFMAWPSAKLQEAFDTRLRNIALLLKAANVEFGYLYGEELYAGALVCDQGMDEVFRAHARKVQAVLEKHGVKRVITVDPHTTDMLRTVYPKVLDGYALEVKSYLEVLGEKGMECRAPLDGDVVVHDSCVYARYENVVDEPRQLLVRAGATVKEQDDSGKLTQCCGGPIESLFPSKAKDIAKTRIAQLEKSGCKNIAAMCPICLLNLTKAANGNGVDVRDISEYLAKAYCGGADSQETT